MLSSTAKNLYWMGRYLQRAKSTARLIEATQRMALQSRGEEAAGVAAIFGMEDEFRQTQEHRADACQSHRLLVLDENNPSSIVSSIARRAQRPRAQRSRRCLGKPERAWLELSSRCAAPRLLVRRPDRIGGERDDFWRSSGVARDPTISCSSAPSSSAPTTPRASST
jgi:hypothetical protein